MKAKLFAAALLLAPTTSHAIPFSFNAIYVPGNIHITGHGEDWKMELGNVLRNTATGVGVSAGFDWTTADPYIGFNGHPVWVVLDAKSSWFFGSCQSAVACGYSVSGAVYHTPGPAVGAGLPGLLMLFALWWRRRCARSC